MEFARKVILFISITSLIILVIGLFRPWIALWWEDVQNRRKVIRLYGGISILMYGLYWLLFYIAPYV
jgi:hypothetical protein